MRALGKILSWPLLGLLAVYRYAISPLLGINCRFHPTCAAYAREALLRHGAFLGTWLAVKRVARCHPWGGAGEDPVPGSDDDSISGGSGGHGRSMR